MILKEHKNYKIKFIKKIKIVFKDRLFKLPISIHIQDKIILFVELKVHLLSMFICLKFNGLANSKIRHFVFLNLLFKFKVNSNT